MSVKIMTLVWEHAPCRENSLMVLLALADWANDEAVCWPSIQKLADKTRIDRRSAQRIIRRLVTDGLITIEEGGGRAKQHKYHIETAALCRPLENGDFRNSGVGDTKRAALETERATFPTQTATPVSPDPLEEPLEEPLVKPPPDVEVFDFWKEFFGHPRAFFDEKRRKAVRARLREGYSVDDLILAVRGCKLTPHNMGQNDRQEIYDDIELICRDTSHVERFITRAEMGANGNGYAKPRTASERNVANIKECLDIIRASSGESDSAESECYVPSRALARRI